MTQLLSIRTITSCLIASLTLIFCQNATAQHRLGLANGNYGGITNLMSNPADIASARYKTYIGIGQTDVHLTNNYFKFGSFNISNTDSVTLLKKDGDYLSGGFDLAALSWIQAINPKISVGLSSRARGALQGVGVTRSLYNTVGFGSDSISTIKNGGLNFGAQIFSEIGLSYAQTLIDNKDYAFKIGATAKRLTGAFATGFSLSKFDAQVIATADGEKYKIANGQLDIAYIGTGNLDDASSFGPSSIFGGKGRGWGFDAGVTYEHRAGNFNNADGTTPYQFRVGASVTDIGSIKYSGSDVRFYSANLKNVNFNKSDSVDLKQSDDVLRAAGINPDSFATSFTAQIPTMLRVNADVRLSNLFFVNVNWANNLANKYQLGTQYASFIAVTPRLETRYFDFSIPLALTNNYKTFGFGFGLRAGPLTLGMDNFTGIFGNPAGINAHAGLNIGIGRRKSAQDMAEKVKEKEKEAEVVEAKTESKSKAGKKSKKAPKEDPLSMEPQKTPVVVAAPKPIESPAAKKSKIAESTPPKAVAVPKPTVPKTDENKQKAPEKAPNLIVSAPKPATSTVPTTVVKPVVKPAEVPTKAATTAAATPKPTVPAAVIKPTVPAAVIKPTASTAVVKPTVPTAVVKPTVPTAVVKTTEKPTGKPTITVEKTRPLSITPPKTATVAATPKPSMPAPAVVETPKAVEMQPFSSGRMGECIAFFPNKAAITGNSAACLREISKFLVSNKNIKLNVSANVLASEKTADAAALKTERAKTIRNFLIQSGVEAARIAIKPSANAGDAPIVLTPQ